MLPQSLKYIFQTYGMLFFTSNPQLKILIRLILKKTSSSLNLDQTNHQAMGEDTYPSHNHNPTHQGTPINYDFTTMPTSARYSNLILDYQNTTNSNNHKI